jgi:hypothetical protein
MLASGEALITDFDEFGRTALLTAAAGTHALPTLIWLLAEGGARVAERNHKSSSALIMAAWCGKIPTCQWLLQHGGVDIADIRVWNNLERHFREDANVTALTSLLKVMVLNGAPPRRFKIILKPEHVRVVEEGVRLRATLPAGYLTQRRAILDAYCPIGTWSTAATGLGVAPQRTRRPRPEAAVALPVPRSARLRQRLE